MYNEFMRESDQNIDNFDKTQVSFGGYLRFLREKKGLTQEQLATLADIDQGYLTQIEKNKKKGSIQTLLNLAKALGIEPPYRIFAFADIEKVRPEDLEQLDFIYLPANLDKEDKMRVNEFITQLSVEKYKQSLEQKYHKNLTDQTSPSESLNR